VGGGSARLQNRLVGKPRPLSINEAEEMLDWIFVVGEAFPEAVDLAIRGPKLQNKIGAVLYLLEKHDAPENYPEAVLRLLNWLLENRDTGLMIASTDLEALLYDADSAPRKKTSGCE
jgi:hypothetical protein